MIEDILGLCGTVVADKYEVLEAVGKGGFAVVYRAKHLLWNRPVALKVFKALGGSSPSGSKALTDDLVKEASVLAELSEQTASICQARDLGVLTTKAGESLPYMVLEWLEGKTLAETLLNEQSAGMPPRSLAASVTLLDPIAEALALAHAHGIAHRDVKPANVFLAVGGDGKSLSVKLLDFGIAKVVQDAQRTGGAFHKTEGQVTSFTPHYGAPEQFSRKFGATGPWTDVFALALVVTECAIGRRIVRTNDFVEMAKLATDTSQRPTPRRLGLDVSDATEAVFTRAVAVMPQDRYPTAGAFWIALLTTLGTSPSRAVLAAAETRDQDLFAGLGSAHTAVASPELLQRLSLPPPARVSALPPPPAPIGPKTSGRTVLAVGSVLGVAFVAGLLLALHYDRATDATASAVAANEAVEATRHTRPPPGSAASSVPSANASATTSPSPPALAPAAASCPDGMVLIPAGEFFMGSDDDSESEKPAHHVTLVPYCIDLYEVTTARYASCSDTGKCKRAAKTNEWPGITPREQEVFDPLCSVRDPTSQADHPIVCVDWEMAKTFCESLPGGRLPTEAEWEFSARGPDGRKYPWGDEAPSGAYLNACGRECVAWGAEAKMPMKAMYPGDDSWPNTSAVGSFPRGKSKFGLFDVAGNVWEWVADWQAPYGKDALANPTGPATGKAKVIRGGAWNGSVASWVRPTFRFMNAPENRSYGVGFRCAASPRDGTPKTVR